MKTLFTRILIFTGLVLLAVACKTSSVTVEVLVPADITVPQHIKKLAIVNRSLPASDQQLNNIVEGVLSGEGIQVDREASLNCINGVGTALVNSPRFTCVIPGNLNLRGTGTAQWPAPLDWAEVKKICTDNGADALVTLETFDSNTGHRLSKENRTRTENGQTINYIEFLAHMDVNINAGWRIYDPKNQQIIDQNVYTDGMSFSKAGNSEDDARKKLPTQRQAVRDAGTFAGGQYAIRISPLWVNVSRMYYIKGNDDFVNAKYQVRSNQWKSATELWLKHTKSGDPKIAGRACYNMALACEIEGQLDAALEWAKKGYADYRNKKARYYMSILTQRIADQQKLKEQMEGN